MFKLLVVVIAVMGCKASPGYDYSGYSAPAVKGDIVGSHAPVLTGGLSSVINTPIGAGYSYGSPYSLGYASHGGGPAHGFAAPFAAFSGHLPVHNFQAHRSVEVAQPHVSHEPIGPQIIEVSGDDQPVQVLFRSHGSRVHVQQLHTPSGPSHVESTRTEEEPHRVVHEVIRPVIQEVREVIQPYRRLTQEIRPVLEEVHTVVAKGEKKYAYAAPQPALVATGGHIGHVETGHAFGGQVYKSKKA